jgi:hypothetical protein
MEPVATLLAAAKLQGRKFTAKRLGRVGLHAIRYIIECTLATEKGK